MTVKIKLTGATPGQEVAAEHAGNLLTSEFWHIVDELGTVGHLGIMLEQLIDLFRGAVHLVGESDAERAISIQDAYFSTISDLLDLLDLMKVGEEGQVFQVIKRVNEVKEQAYATFDHTEHEEIAEAAIARARS